MAENEKDLNGLDDMNDLQPIVAKIKQKYPYRGPSFYIVIGMFVVTAVMIMLCIFTGFLKSGMPSQKWIRYLYVVMGIFLVIVAVPFSFKAKNESKIESAVLSCRLVTDGVYALVRNPMDTSALFICTGAFFIYGNTYLYALVLVYWAVLTVCIKKTEEIWLRREFGKDYAIYYDTVSRFVPMKPGSRH